MPNCGYALSREYYKMVDIILNTCYMSKIPMKIRVKCSMLSSMNLSNNSELCLYDSILLETKYNNTFIKVIDINEHGLNPDVVYPISYLIGLSAMRTNPNEPNYSHDILFNVYNFIHFLDKHNIEFKYDNMIVVCNIRDLDNAYWNGSYLSFGAGSRGHTPLTSSMIVAHELSHALIQQVSGLEYEGQTGALNESFADIIGVSFEFFIYDHFTKTLGFELGSECGLLLRNMADPHQCQQPQKVGDEYYMSPSCYYDNGGVHINSGIPNHVYYCIEQFIGYKRTFDLFIRVLYKLNRYSTFKDFRQALLLVNSSMNYIDRKKLSDILDEHGL